MFNLLRHGARSLLQNLHHWLHSFSSQPSQFQTFILEQILTPSGLIDGGDFDETPDLDATIELDPDINAFSPDILDLGDEDMDFIPFIPTDTLEQFESGVFTVGETGEIEIDYLYDGGGYQGELAIFSLEGMEEYDLGSPEFIREAARRALGNDPDAVGQVVISDINEGAKLGGRYLKEGNFNRGEYQGTTKVSLNGGERFAFMLVPNGTVQQVYDGLNGSNGELAKSLRPLFSLSTANPEDGLSLGQIADVTGDGHTFVMEDLRVDGWTDEDYNDIIFQVKGATGKAVALDEVIDPDLDWRETQLGEDLYAAITPDVPELPVDPVTGAEYIPGQLLVKFDADLSDAEVQTLAESYGATEFERLIPEDPDANFALEQWRLLNFDPDRDVVQIRDAIAQETGVVASELNGVRSLHWQPDDTHFGDLWGLHNTNDADIDAPEAWEIQRGSKDVVVAVIDTGVDYTHPDLADNMWRNPGEIAGDGLDNDKNGYVDDIHGYDFGNKDSDPKPDYLPLFLGYDPDYGHGTHVAGTIGAVGNNDLGVTGVSPNVSLMALNARNSPHGLSVDATIRAIHYAVNHGADIINGSFGKEVYLESDYDALSYANDHDVLFVASAGNDGKNNDIYGQYPASYNLPNIISVAATDSNDNLAAVHSDGGLSNYGLNTVDLGAPGRSILSTTPHGNYENKTGTSMAAPHVAGAAALLLAENPTWSATDLKAAILAGVDKKDSLKGITVSGGRLNLYTPLQQGLPPNIPPTVTLEVLDGEASEDGNAAHLLVQLDEAGDRDVTVYYTLDGTAKNAEDYLELSGEITIPAGAKQARIPVVSLHDYEAEGEETLEISLKSDANYNLGTNNTATITITNSTKTHRYGPFVYINPQNGHQYLMTEEDTWHGAQAQAEALGGNLVSINSQAENDWLINTFGTKDFWIGFTDSEFYGQEEGKYAWVSGENSTYTNWGAGLPNNTLYTPEGEDFAHLLSGSTGKWSDLPKEGTRWQPINGIIEVDPTTLSQPIVNIMVTDDEAGEDGNAGQIVITRVGKLDEDLTINYNLAGDAINGQDYATLSGQIKIPAGKSLVTIPIKALYDGIFQEGEETVIINLASGEYEIGTHATGQVKINENYKPFTITPEFVRQWGTVGQDRAAALTSDAAGNIYVVGSTYGDLDGNKNADSGVRLWSDPFITKYDAQGQKVWTRQLGTKGFDYYSEVAVDDDGNIFAIGYDDSQPRGVFGTGDHKFVKWDSEGNLLWEKLLGTSSHEFSSGLKIDPDGNVVIAGWTQGQFGQSSQGGADYFVAKYDTDGNPIWIQQNGTSTHDRGRDVAIDNAGNIYTVGITEGSLVGENIGNSDVFVTKYDRNGQELWTKQFGTDGNESPGTYGSHGHSRNVSVDIDDSSQVYISATTDGALEGHENQGNDDVIILKLDEEGNTLWTQQLGGLGYDRNTGISVDNQGYFYLSGWTNDSIDNQPRLGHAPFLTKFDTEGNKLWTTIYGTSDAEEFAHDIEIDSSGNVYTTGYTTGNFGGVNAGNVNDGLRDIWLAKFPANPIVFEPTIYTNPETGNQYFVTTPDTWLGAQEQAKALGGNLVTINNAAEGQWLIDTFEAHVSWHGLHDSPIYGAYEGEYQWINGQPVTYTNWRPGEPNNQFHTGLRYSEGEDFMHYLPDGLWNDLPPDGLLLKDIRGIVEIDSTIANNAPIQTYLGEDLNTQGIPLNTTPNTDAAKADFLANLENTQIVDFDNYSIGDRPTTLNFGNVRATLSGDLRVDAESNSTGNSLYSYNDMAFSIDFDSPQSAFGMTIHDAEDKPLQMTVYHTDGTTRKFAIPVQAVYPENSDSALFYGITDRVPFDKVTVHKRATTENLRLDDLIIGDLKA